MRLRTSALAFVLCVRCAGWQTNLPILPLGKGDVINVEVEGEDDLTKRLTISNQGDITMPMLKEHLHVEGMLPEAIETLIAAAYKQAKLLIDPTVRVTPAEYHSYLVKVTGAVVRPYEFQATERVTLLDVLARAGGPTTSAAGQIEVIRLDPETRRETREVIPIRSLLDDDDPKYNVVLKGGEEVRLPSVPAVAK